MHEYQIRNFRICSITVSKYFVFKQYFLEMFLEVDRNHSTVTVKNCWSRYNCALVDDVDNII